MSAVPGRLTDAALTEQAASTFNRGGARCARYLLQVAEADREVVSAAAHIFCNTSPGWRLSDAHGYVVTNYLRGGVAGAQALVDSERERREYERELRQRVPGAVVFHDRTVGVPNPDTLIIEEQS